MARFLSTVALSSVLFAQTISADSSEDDNSFTDGEHFELVTSSDGAVLPIPRRMFVANLIDDNIYTFGGLQLIDGTPGVFPVGQYETNFITQGTIDNNIYTDGWFVGQNNGLLRDSDPSGIYLACEDTVATAKIARFDIHTGQLTQVAPIPPQFRADDCCAAIYQDNIYIFGGLREDGVELNTVVIYDFSTDTFSTGATMPFSRSDQTCVQSSYNNNNLVSLFGRSTGDDVNLDKYGTIQIYDLDDDSWTQIPYQNNEFETLFRSLQYERGIYLQGTKYNLIIGGDTGSPPNSDERYIRDAFLYNLDTNKFETSITFPSLVERRAAFSLVGTFNKDDDEIDICLIAIGGYSFYDTVDQRGEHTDSYETICFEIEIDDESDDDRR